ncbi:MAG: hypothetical protein E7283_03085 [Lachnospiraceae bacterium]|nr:hypothetical protein [Lachnospiraceae bacterium]
MKKIIALLLVVAMGVGCMACGNSNNNNSQVPSETEKNTNTENSQNSETSETDSDTEAPLQITDANEILQKVWAKYADNEKFAAVGGHFSKYTDGGPAKYDISHVADIEAVFCIPAEAVAMLDDAASLQHGMNVNNFSAMACHIKEGADIQVIINGIKNMTLNNQWLCGHPDRLIIVTIGDEYLVTAFGDGQIIDHFQNKLMSIYDNAPELVVDEDL